jgi:acyl carrier protein
MDARFDAVVAEIFELEEGGVKDDLTPETVDLWDSLAQLRLVTTLEEEFGIRLSMDEIESIRSIGGLREIVRRHAEAA